MFSHRLHFFRRLSGQVGDYPFFCFATRNCRRERDEIAAATRNPLELSYA